ncbi:hypothetical protein evm_003372 [Chilo suppressalis]|nr:hypothetical protein evm_003372 [Chilo suppressalis]
MSNRPTSHQLEALVEFLEQNPGIKQESKRKWAELAVSLNALGGVTKDGPGWSKYWAEKQCGLKRLCAQHTASMRQTGGGAGERLVLSELDNRLVAVMGGPCFASGDSELAVNPFPNSQLMTEAGEIPIISANDAILALGSEEIMDEELLLPPPLPTAGTSTQDTSAGAGPVSSPSNSATNATRRRSRRLLSRSVDAEIDRMARIEERRVEAERLTAEAFANASRSFDRLADAADRIAEAHTRVANALEPITVPTAGAQAFSMDGIGRLDHDPPRAPSADWGVLTTADAAGTNRLTCLPKHGGARDSNYKFMFKN